MVSHRRSERPAPSRPVPKSDWDRPPWNRWSFQHVREILPTAEVWRGRGPVRQLPRDERQLDELPVDGVGGKTVTLRDFLDQTYTDGFLVLKRGAVVYERYFNGMDERTLHLSQSVAKSFAGILAGILAGRGMIDVNAPVTEIVPELEATAYRGARIQHLLDMASGVRFSEDYTDPYSGMGRADVASGWKSIPTGADPRLHWPQTIFELILGLREREAEHGDRFSYRSIETDVLAFALERASGKRFAQLLSDELWQKLGMEESANMTVDSAGFALADGGLNACLRDYGRFGQMIVENGAGIVPASWIEATRSGDRAVFGTPFTSVLPEGAYRNQFWIEDQQSRNLMARGVFGQLIYISWKHQMVVVKLSSWPNFVNSAWTLTTLEAVRRIGTALSRSA
ncbi:MAG: 6-aminohexanoate-dimer hydrolase [Hyphomicrobiales bacterium]|nr:6-aminohexanoate-dimer hydrolase [Hyphomicrobiales bacterium]